MRMRQDIELSDCSDSDDSCLGLSLFQTFHEVNYNSDSDIGSVDAIAEDKPEKEHRPKKAKLVGSVNTSRVLRSGPLRQRIMSKLQATVKQETETDREDLSVSEESEYDPKADEPDSSDFEDDVKNKESIEKFMSLLGPDDDEEESSLVYDVVNFPGPLTSHDISDDNEYYLFRFPVGLLNPSQLVGTKFCIGSKTPSMIETDGRLYEVSSHKHSAVNMPTVFLPDKSGQLNQVDMKIKSHVVIRKSPQNTDKIQEIDINALRVSKHKPPEIKERSFFGKQDIQKLGKIKVKKEKIKREIHLSEVQKGITIKKENTFKEKKFIKREDGLAEEERNASLKKKKKNRMSLEDPLSSVTPKKKKKKT